MASKPYTALDAIAGYREPEVLKSILSRGCEKLEPQVVCCGLCRHMKTDACPHRNDNPAKGSHCGAFVLKDKNPVKTQAVVEGLLREGVVDTRSARKALKLR